MCCVVDHLRADSCQNNVFILIQQQSEVTSVDCNIRIPPVKRSEPFTKRWQQLTDSSSVWMLLCIWIITAIFIMLLYTVPSVLLPEAQIEMWASCGTLICVVLIGSKHRQNIISLVLHLRHTLCCNVCSRPESWSTVGNIWCIFCSF